MKGTLITLEPMDIKKHAEGYFMVSQDVNIHKYVGNTVPDSVDEIIELLKVYEEYFINWMIVSNETKEVIGIMRLGKPVIENELLVAGESQRLNSKFWRKGHIREAKTMFYDYVFNELKVDILYADVWEGNTNSIKSLEFSGYKLIDTQNDIFAKSGETIKKYIYSFTREDYLMSKK